jgi:hypothetical protein
MPQATRSDLDSKAVEILNARLAEAIDLTADIFTAYSRAFDESLWFLEAQVYGAK